ncbi:MAG: hypothetical protein ACM3XO_05820 [Bacteroidota bacterium]
MSNDPSEAANDNQDFNIFSFIIRVWKEDPSSEEEKDIWRGHIAPIPDGNRHYFTDFDEIPAFMRDYCKSMK